MAWEARLGLKLVACATGKEKLMPAKWPGKPVWD